MNFMPLFSWMALNLGKKSTKENKSIYQICREEAGMTREEASKAMEFVSDSRIEKFESGRSPVQPEEVLAMARLLTKMDDQA